MSRFLVSAFACVVLVLSLSACGGGTGDAGTGNIAMGPLTYAIPFVPNASGESQVLGFRNLTSTPGSIYATAFLPDGTLYPPGEVRVDVPAWGGVQRQLAFFTGPALTLGGWVEIETRNPMVLDPATGSPTPTATSGFIQPYVERVVGTLDSDSYLPASFRDDFAYVSLNRFTIAYQVINRSYMPGVGGETPVPLPVDLVVYDAFGTPGPVIPTVVPAYGSALFVPTVSTGRVEVTPSAAVPAGTEVRLTVADLEDDPQVFIEARLASIEQTVPQRFVGFDVEFGIDAPGNVYDFVVQVTNATTTNANVTFEGAYLSDGTALLPTPRIVAVDAKRTKFLATTNTDSQGLDTGEVSPFSDIFGDVSLATGLDVCTVVFNVPPEVSISARGWNRFKSFYRVLPGRKLTTQVATLGIEVPVTTATGARNYTTLMNPRSNELQVMIRGYTPGGTEYMLDPVLVPPFGRIDWSADGMLFTEDPTDVTAPQVPFMSFLFTGQGGMFFNARRVWRDLVDLEIRAIAPQAVRDLRVD